MITEEIYFIKLNSRLTIITQNKDKEAKENKLNLNVSTMIDADVFDDEVKERDPQDMISDSQEKAQEVESRKEGAQSEEEKSIDALTDDVFDDEKKEKDPQEMMSDSQEKAQEDESSKEGAQLEEEKTYEENPTSNTSD